MMSLQVLNKIPLVKMMKHVSRLAPGIRACLEVFAMVLDPTRSIGAVRTMSKVLNMTNLNPNVIKLEYAVRGPLVIRAAEIDKEIQEASKKSYLYLNRNTCQRNLLTRHNIKHNFLSRY